jgi:hypothetical protein
MEKWFVPPQMSRLANQVVDHYGYDTQHTIKYCFNSLGFRSPEPVTHPGLVVIGNSVSFGIGVDILSTYGGILSAGLNRSLDNFAFGCYFHENHDHLNNLKLLSEQDRDLIFLIQINNLDRRRNQDTVVSGNDHNWCVNRFLDFFEQSEVLLKKRPHVYLYWDNVNYELPNSVDKLILIKNHFHIDTSICNARDTFGPKSHAAIAKTLSYLL